MRRTLPALFCLLILLSFAGQARAKTVEVASVITAIEVKGNSQISSKDILDEVFARVGDALSEEKIKADLKAVYAMGYFSDVTSSFVPFAGGTKVVINVAENPRVENIVFDGNTVYSSSEMLALISTRKGEILNY